MEYYRLQLDPCTAKTLTLSLVRGVKNCKQIRSEVMSGKLQCCLMKPSLIYDTLQVAVAANRAVLSHQAGRSGSPVTKSIYTEILFNLSISKNISQSLTKFGIGDNDQDILVAVLDGEGESRMDDVLPRIDGRVVPLNELKVVQNVNEIINTYRIKQPELSQCPLLDSVISRIATSDFAFR